MSEYFLIVEQAGKVHDPRILRPDALHININDYVAMTVRCIVGVRRLVQCRHPTLL